MFGLHCRTREDLHLIGYGPFFQSEFLGCSHPSLVSCAPGKVRLKSADDLQTNSWRGGADGWPCLLSDSSYWGKCGPCLLCCLALSVGLPFLSRQGVPEWLRLLVRKRASFAFYFSQLHHLPLGQTINRIIPKRLPRDNGKHSPINVSSSHRFF